MKHGVHQEAPGCSQGDPDLATGVDSAGTANSSLYPPTMLPITIDVVAA